MGFNPTIGCGDCPTGTVVVSDFDYTPFLNRISGAIELLEQGYDYEDAEVEAEEIGLDTHECHIMALENHAQLGLVNLKLARDVIQKLTAPTGQKQ